MAAGAPKNVPRSSSKKTPARRSPKNLFANATVTTEPPVSIGAMKAAEEFLADVAKHNGPAPTDAELDEMVRSWPLGT